MFKRHPLIKFLLLIVVLIATYKYYKYKTYQAYLHLQPVATLKGDWFLKNKKELLQDLQQYINKPIACDVAVTDYYSTSDEFVVYTTPFVITNTGVITGANHYLNVNRDTIAKNNCDSNALNFANKYNITRHKFPIKIIGVLHNNIGDTLLNFLNIKNCDIGYRYFKSYVHNNYENFYLHNRLVFKGKLAAAADEFGIITIVVEDGLALERTQNEFKYIGNN